MARLQPLPSSTRHLLYLAFAASALAAFGYVGRLAMESHVAAGFDVLSDDGIEMVAPGSPADVAGLRRGDRLSAPEGWRNGPPTEVRVEQGGRYQTLTLVPDAPTFVDRLLRLGGYRWVLLFVGLAALTIGWWVVDRNPDAPGVVPFALWSASTALVYPIIGPSLVWSEDMWTLYVGWEIVFHGVFHAFGIHWILRFPRPLGGRHVVIAVYAIAGMAVLGLFVLAARMGYPRTAIHLRAGLAALAVLVLCIAQLARAPTRRARRQAAWILLAIVIYVVLDLTLWELPTLLGHEPSFATEGTLNALVGLSYLVIPAGIAIAVTRERLFGIERLVTPGLSYGAAVGVLAFTYAGAAYGLSMTLGRADGSLPTGIGIALAAALAALLVPMQQRMFRLLGRVFDRPEHEGQSVLDAFEARATEALDAPALRHALTSSLCEGLGLESCRLTPEPQEETLARPGALEAGPRHTVRLDPNLNAALAVPLSKGIGTLWLGSRHNGRRFTEDHLDLIAVLSRRFARAAERLHLLRQLGERDLEMAHTRLRIAGDLHDDIGASLSSMAVLSDLVRRNDDLPDADRARLDRLSTSARALVDDLRDIVWTIDPGADRARDLAERLRDTASSLLPGVRCTVEAPGSGDLAVDMETRRQVLLVAKEALHNVARHADASRVSLHLGIEAGTLTLRIEDDGRGFDPETASGGHGLRSLRQRAERLGGTLTIDSAPGEGTRLTLLAPRAAPNGANAS